MMKEKEKWPHWMMVEALLNEAYGLTPSEAFKKEAARLSKELTDYDHEFLASLNVRWD